MILQWFEIKQIKNQESSYFCDLFDCLWFWMVCVWFNYYV